MQATNYINADGIAQIVATNVRDPLKSGIEEQRHNLRLVARHNAFEGCLDAPDWIPAGGTVYEYTLFGAYQSAFAPRV